MTPILLALALLAADPTELHGNVVHVTDGDTLIILMEKTEVKIRLAGIDAPESKQPWGTKSKEHLSELVHGESVRVVTSGKDRYGRTIGTVYVGETNANESMLESGLAWHYVRYSKSKRLGELETTARMAKRGLWADPNPVPPWEWRAGKR